MTQQDMNTINIKGKEYVPVNERIRYFNDNYENGSIRTELVSDVSSENIVIKATVYPNVDIMERYYTGYSQAVVGDGYINKTSALENAETSAVGRALGMMGIGISESIASSDEIDKALNATLGEEVKGVCTECGTTGLITKVVDFSTKKYGRVLCYSCQQKEKGGNQS